MFVVVSTYYHHCLRLHSSSTRRLWFAAYPTPAAEVSAALAWASFPVLRGCLPTQAVVMASPSPP